MEATAQDRKSIKKDKVTIRISQISISAGTSRIFGRYRRGRVLTVESGGLTGKVRCGGRRTGQKVERRVDDETKDTRGEDAKRKTGNEKDSKDQWERKGRKRGIDAKTSE